jgi:thioredoxin-like negative regulator of GroEL
MAAQIPQQGAGTPDREQLLKMAITSAKQGNKQAARMMFQQVLASDPRNERAMMWMGSLADTTEEQNQWMQRVLAVNPLNEQAAEILRKQQYKKKAKENRTLLLFGVLAGVLIVLLLVVLIIIFARPF